MSDGMQIIHVNSIKWAASLKWAGSHTSTHAKTCFTPKHVTMANTSVLM